MITDVTDETAIVALGTESIRALDGTEPFVDRALEDRIGRRAWTA